MKRIVRLGVAALMTVTALAGCSSSSSNSYCDDIKSATTQFKGLSSANLGGADFAALNTAVHKVAGEAPSDIKSQWTTLANLFDTLQGAMDGAGLSTDDATKLLQGNTTGIDPAKLAKFATAMKNFNTTGITAASNKIQTEVKSECNIDLNAGP